MADAFAGGVKNRVRDRGGRARDSDLADAASTKIGHVRIRFVDEIDIELRCQNVAAGRDQRGSCMFGLFRFERSHVDRKPVLHIRLEQSLVGFVHLLDRDDFDIGSDIMLAAKVEHLLRFGDAADHRA
jgi:hypothetical protein